MKYTFSLCFLTIFFSAKGQDRDSLNFVTIFLEKDTLGLIDPFQFEISLVNNEIVPKEIYPLTFYAGELLYGDINIEIKEVKDSTWMKINNCLDSRHLEYNAHGKTQVVLMPGGQVKSDPFSCALPPLKVGTYEVRAVYKNYDRVKNGKESFSNAIKIFVSDYSGDDKSVYEHLQGLSNPSFIYDPIYNKPIDTTFIFIAERITREYPKSKFIPYADLYLCQAYYYLSRESAIDNKYRAIRYIRLSRKSGLSVLNSDNVALKPRAKLILDSQYNFIYTKIFSSIDDIPLDLDNEFQTYNKNKY